MTWLKSLSTVEYAHFLAIVQLKAQYPKFTVSCLYIASQTIDGCKNWWYQHLTNLISSWNSWMVGSAVSLYYEKGFWEYFESIICFRELFFVYLASWKVGNTWFDISCIISLQAQLVNQLQDLIILSISQVFFTLMSVIKTWLFRIKCQIICFLESSKVKIQLCQELVLSKQFQPLHHFYHCSCISQLKI